MMNKIIWHQLKCSSKELQLKVTLTGGQSFRWKLCDEDTYIGVMANCVWQLRQTEDHLMYRILGELITKDESKYYNQVRIKVAYANCRNNAVKKEKKTKLKNGSDPQLPFNNTEYYESLLRSYFRLNINLSECYEKWSLAHQHFASEAGKFYAIRVLDQDPVENLFSFICSQNNHISRISSLVEKLCKNYGPKICDYEGVTYHAFPNYDAMMDVKVEEELRKESFGYRAKYIQRAATEVNENGGLDWFQNIQNMPYKEAHQELIKLTGIGPKVADCICLMSLNHLEAIPVDTHVLKIATEHYISKRPQTKSMTPKLYNEIGDAFRDVYGPLAGWAQTVLFCADLAKFKENSKEFAVENGCSGTKKRKK